MDCSTELTQIKILRFLKISRSCDRRMPGKSTVSTVTYRDMGHGMGQVGCPERTPNFLTRIKKKNS